MRFLTLFLALVGLSLSAYSAHAAGKDKIERPGIVEKRQNRAKEIMKDNFNASTKAENKTKKNSNFGFKKIEKKDSQSL